MEDENGRRFLFDYDERGELASRDIVSKAMYHYSRKTGLKIYLAFNNFDEEYFAHRFPNIYKNLRSLGYKVPQQRVPISPAFHYAIGGIKTDLDAKVPSVKNLYAVGEVASTRVHGANRLASNSLLEGMVFAKKAVDDILQHIDEKKEDIRFDLEDEEMSLKNDKNIKNQLRRIMWENVSIVRTKGGLNDALETINALLNENIGKLLRFRLLTAKEIVTSALKRSESIGVHTIQEEK